MNQIDMWKAMELDPYKTHLMIIVAGGKRALLEFVKQMAIAHKLCLTVKPTIPYTIQRWKDLSRCILKEILPHNPDEFPTAIPSKQYISKEIYESCVRRAYWRKYKGRSIIVKATIVNPMKLDKATRAAMWDMVNSFNDAVVEVARRGGVVSTTIPDIAGWNK
jgi:hypothetical protein